MQGVKEEVREIGGRGRRGDPRALTENYGDSFVVSTFNKSSKKTKQTNFCNFFSAFFAHVIPVKDD